MIVDYLNLKDINALHKEELTCAVTDVISSGRYLQGKRVALFEKHYAQYIGTPYCVSCASGLDALKLILMGEILLGKLQPGDEILVPANTYIATILAITETGLSPILVEPNLTTLQIDEQEIEKYITKKSKALMMVHLYGKCALTQKIQSLCQKYHLLLFEDNAQAQGCQCEFLSQKTGSLGVAAAHSFYPGKNLGAMGDAGAVTTHNEELANIVRALGNYGSNKKYVFPFRGLNSRMDEMQATILDVKLNFLDRENEQRRKVAFAYLQGLKKTNECQVPWQNDEKTLSHPTSNVFHIFPILALHREALQHDLAAKGIQTLIHYPIPPHHQKCYAAWQGLNLPLTEFIHKHELSLPCNQLLTPAQVQYVIDSVNAFRI